MPAAFSKTSKISSYVIVEHNTKHGSLIIGYAIDTARDRFWCSLGLPDISTS